MHQSVLAFLGKFFLATAVLAIASSNVQAATSLDSEANAAEQASVTEQVSAEQSSQLIAQDSDDDGGDDGDDDGDDGGDDDDDDNDDDGESVELSQSVSRQILQQISQREGISVSSLRIVQVQRQTWSDGCLGLGGDDAVCTQALVPGYRVTVANNQQTWVYRTNESGSVVVLDAAATQTASSSSSSSSSQTSSSTQTTQTRTTRTTQTSQSTQTQFSQTIATSIFQSISQRFQVQSSQLRVVEARQTTWPNSCLGLQIQGTTCQAGSVQGWQVLVAGSNNQVWVYRTDATGSVVAFDERATQTLRAQIGSQTTQQTSQTQIQFSDVSTSFWAYPFILRLAQLNIIEGFPNGTYRPSEAVTKAQFAAMLRRAFEMRQVRQSVNFTDVSTSYWAYTAIREAYSMGFFGADTDNQFNPTQRLTRQDILVAIARGLGYTSTTSSVSSILQVYSDASSASSEVQTLIAALTERGIIVNYPNTNRLELSRVATRAEVAALIYQSLVSIGRVESISSTYIVNPTGGTTTNTNTNTNTTTETEVDDDGDDDDDDDDQGRRQNCNQGIGNGAEGCDPGNSSPRGGSNDEGGRTPGNRP